MTRTQRLMMLIEAWNPIAFDEMQSATGWSRTVLNRALFRLCEFGVVVRVHVSGENRRLYKPC